MKVLVIGGTRFIGKAVAEHAHALGHSVILFNRGHTTTRFETVRGNVDEILRFKQDLLSLNPDVVVHCIAYTEKHAEDLVKIFAATKTHLIVLSSQDCYEAFQQLNRGKEVSDFPIHEEMQTSSNRYYWRGLLDHDGGSDYDKNLMTDVLMKAASARQIRTTIFRVTQVYGPRDHQYSFRHGPIIRRIFDRRKTAEGEDHSFVYLIRLVAFLLILYAILDKNKKETRRKEFF